MREAYSLKRLFTVLLFIFIFWGKVGVLSVSAQVSLTTNRTSLKVAIRRLKSKTKYRFFYNDELAKKSVNAVSIRDLPITFVLNRLFDKTGITYTIVDDVIYLKKEQQLPVVRQENDVNTKGNKVAKEQATAPVIYTFQGQVTDTDGMPLIGTTITQKGGDKVYAVADLEGRYVIKSDNPHPVLVFSYIGFDTVEKVASTNHHMTVVLKESSYELHGVVVTAMGIGRSSKALNYDVKQLSNSDINTVKTSNIGNALIGKIAGASINESAAGMGGAARIIMRGPKSLAQSNQPLYVIDGIPVNNRSNDAIKSGIYSVQPGAEGISDINPDDVESVSVLSGAAAAALYGSAAAQGVIMITTKSARTGKLAVEWSSSMQVSTPLVLPKFQNEYINRPNEMKSWGEKQTTSYSPRDFFKHGLSFINTISLTKGTEHNQFYLSLGSTDMSGIVPNNDYQRYNFTFKNITSMLKDKLRFTFSLKLIREKDRNMLAQGQYFNPLTSVYLFPRGEDFSDIKNFERFDVVRGIPLQNWRFGDDLKMQNPYWITNRMVKSTQRNRYLTDLDVKYDVSSWLGLEGRLRWDQALNKIEDKRYASTLDVFSHSPYGYYGYSKVDDHALYGDVRADVTKQWGDLSLAANVGVAFTHTNYDVSGWQGGLKAPSNIFTPNAIDYGKVSSDNRPIYDITQHTISSLFGSVELGWKKRAHVTITGRNDWDSALSNTAQQSFFYPSLGFSYIISDLIHLPRFIDYLKVRTSWASVGSAISPNISSAWRYEYVPSTGTYKTITYKFPKTFYPERTNSWEAGLVAYMFKGAFTLNLSFYQSNTRNQTFLRPITIGGPYNREYIQAGNVRNRGLELSLNYNKEWGKLLWQVGLNYSMNRNKIIRLLDNPKETLRQGGLNGCEVILKQGGTMGDLYTFTDFRRDADGNILLNDTYQVMQTELPTPQYIGSVLPKANLGISNKFTWRGLNFGLLLTARFGGLCVSQTQALMDSYGVSQKTAVLRDYGGVKVYGLLISAEKYYAVVGGETPIWAEYIYSATNVRIKEAYISYTFKRLFKKATLTLGLTARNLLMIYNKAPFDPEATPSTDVYYQGFDYFMQPSQRTVALNVNIKF